ncbi:MAG: tetratricopeptide repeat protein [Crocinitomicaceae bacterium]|nr:tetratricopeptide repeat protein [Crocinitomicaceae bacterium]
MKLIQSLFILLFASTSCFAEEGTPLTTEEKLEILEEVYVNIYNAMGINEDRPILKLDSRRSRSVAYLKKGRDGGKIIAVEEKAFDICMELGVDSKNALAFLMAHELGHFRYDHHWGGEFASSFAIADIQDEIADASKKMGELKFYETQADQMGGIYCYLAGYNIAGIGEILLPKMYEAYGLPAINKKYPTLTQRIEITQQNDAAMKLLVNVYEAGTYALLLGEYAEARRCFQHCLNKGFKSREVYNNIGVASFLEAAELIGKDEVIYAYPVELDVEARIGTDTKGFASNVEELLESAAEKFEQAIRFDPSYATAYLNKACVFSLQKKFEDAEYYGKKALRIARENGEDNTAGNALCILGIVYHQMGEQEDAEEKLKEGQSTYDNYLCDVNLNVVKGKRLEAVEWINRPTQGLVDAIGFVDESSERPARETLDGVVDFMEDLEGEELEEIKMYKGSCYYLNFDNSRILNLTTVNDEELFFQICSRDYVGETERGITIGTESKKVIKKYGMPDVAIPTRTGMLYYYSSPKIVFFTLDGKVERWMVYRTY